MNVKKPIHGFRFTRSRDIPEISATLHEAVHEKSGAELYFIEREDTNKTFAITFKTIPEDDTGVFHIIEHSVLCGSEKFPVKEPFVDLLKTSLKTFLNAFTFPDKTMYPVSSRCDRDFLNLIDVYMDAVLHPMALKKPEIFYQEGWHYELHEGEDSMQYKGVVFNEMKGAYSSADELEYEYSSRLLYRGTPYAYDSGGDPEKIPTLTYEKFKAAHAKYYHPSAAKIVLDGSVDLDSTLELINSYLSAYEKKKPPAPIPRVERAGHIEQVAKYEISPSESKEGKLRITLGYKAFPFDKRAEALALSVAIDAISGTNEAPFKQRLLASGLMEDVYFSPYDGIQENSVLLSIKNIKEENLEQVLALVREAFEDIVREGIDKRDLIASVRRSEFRLREQDAGGYPMGIGYAIAIMEQVLYGGDALEGLCFEGVLEYINSLIEGDGYEKLLHDVFLASPHSSALYLYPEGTLGEERERKEAEALAEALSAMSAAERDEIIRKTLSTESWQTSEDSEENRSKLPKLSVSDIPKEPEKLPTEAYNIGENKIIYTNINSRGITYLYLLFDVSDLEGEELFNLSVLTEILENVDTESYTARELQTRIKTELGTFSSSVFTTGKIGEPRSYLRVSASYLAGGEASLSEIIREVLLTSNLSDSERISKVIRQLKLSLKETITQGGHIAALGRASAYVCSEAAANEYTDGIEAYRLIEKLDRTYSKAPSEFSEKLNALISRIIVRERVTVAYSGVRCDSEIEKLLSIFPSGSAAVPKPVPTLGSRRSGIVIPSQVSYAAAVGAPLNKDERLHGSLAVVRNILSYGYLWNEIRVQGGAYGAGFVQRQNGTLGFYSYRDPSPSRSLNVYTSAAEQLRGLADEGCDLTDYIIGAIGDVDPLYTPKVISALAFALYLRGETYETRLAHRQEMLATSVADLRYAANLIDKALAEGAVCIIGTKDKITAADLDEIIEI